MLYALKFNKKFKRTAEICKKKIHIVFQVCSNLFEKKALIIEIQIILFQRLTEQSNEMNFDEKFQCVVHRCSCMYVILVQLSAVKAILSSHLQPISPSFDRFPEHMMLLQHYILSKQSQFRSARLQNKCEIKNKRLYKYGSTGSTF